MNRRFRPHTAARYELRVAGHLGEHWSAWFGALVLTREDDGTTTLRGTVADQAELHGILAKIRDVGAPLLSVTSDATQVAPHDADATDAADQASSRTGPGAHGTGSQEREHR